MASTAAMASIAAVEAIVEENRCVTVNEITAHPDMSHESAHRIIHDVMRFHKVSARWVPCQLTAKLKEHVDACQELLKHFEAEYDGFLGRIVTEDETWARNQESEQGMAPYLLTKTKKFCTQPYAGKVILTLFWDERGVILEQYMPRRKPVTSATYADLLKNHLHPAIKSK